MSYYIAHAGDTFDLRHKWDTIKLDYSAKCTYKYGRNACMQLAIVRVMHCMQVEHPNIDKSESDIGV